jgi:hypothetical protein
MQRIAAGGSPPGRTVVGDEAIHVATSLATMIAREEDPVRAGRALL